MAVNQEVLLTYQDDKIQDLQVIKHHESGKRVNGL